MKNIGKSKLTVIQLGEKHCWVCKYGKTIAIIIIES